VLFSNVAFLQQLSDQSRRQSRLRHLLVLAARILAVASLVLAFSRPYLPAAHAPVDARGNAVGIWVDNSFSMDALGTAGRLLDEAKDRARRIAGIYQPSDRFLLLTNDLEGRHQRFVSREEFLRMLEEVPLSPRIQTLGGIMERQSILFGELGQEAGKSYYISDFQKSTLRVDEARPDTSLTSFLVPLPAQQADNVFIDSCWFDAPVRLPGQTVSLHVALRQDGGQALSGQPVRLFIDGVQRTVASYDLEPGGRTEVVLSWTLSGPGTHQAWVEVVDYPVTFDDRLFFSFRVTQEVPVLAIEQPPGSPYLRALFGPDTTFRFLSVPAFAADLSSLPRHHLVVLQGLQQLSPGLAQALGTYVDQGGSLAVFPGGEADLDSYNAFLSDMGMRGYGSPDTVPTRVTLINERHALFRDVFEELPERADLPAVSRHYRLEGGGGSTGEELLGLMNGRSFLSVQEYGRGRVYLSAVPISQDHSNFQDHPVFVPALVNMALMSSGLEPLYHVLGSAAPILLRQPLEGPGVVYAIRGDDSEMIPGQRRLGNQVQLMVRDQLYRAGNYGLHAGDTAIMGLSFNYDRRESLLDPHSPAELAGAGLDAGLQGMGIIDGRAEDFGISLEALQTGRQLWRLFLWMALAFLLAEVLLLRLLR